MGEFLARFPAIVVGLPAGVAAALWRGTVGLGSLMFFSAKLGWTLMSGRIAVEFDIPHVTGFTLIDSLFSTDEGAFTSAVSHLILPTIVLGTIPLAVVARMMRSLMLEVLLRTIFARRA